MLRRFLYLMVAALLWGNIAQAEKTGLVNPRIIGGTPALTGAQPWMASLLTSYTVSASLASFCGATLIRSDVVVTAAHCVEGFVAEDLDVVLGTTDLSQVSASDRIGVASIVVHPDYDWETYDSDIALLKLERASDGVPIELVTATAMSQMSEGQMLTTLGWGMTSATDTNSYVDVLRQVDLPYVSQSSCIAAVGSGVTNNMFCAGTGLGDKDSCQGDSGGPIIWRQGETAVLAGLVSWGDGRGCAVVNTYGVYVRLAAYLDWIKQTMSRVHFEPVGHLGYLNQGASSRHGFWAHNWNLDSAAQLGPISAPIGQIFSSLEHQCDEIEVNASCRFEVLLTNNIVGFEQQLYSISFNTGYQQQVVMSADVLTRINVGEEFSQGFTHWFSGGAAMWQQDPGNPKVYASGSVTHSESSVLQTTVEGPGLLNFSWAASTEKDYDYLDLYINGELYDWRTGNALLWDDYALEFPAGDYVLSWRYVRDFEGGFGADKAWLKGLSWQLLSAPVRVSDGGNGGGGSISIWAAFGILVLLRIGGRINKIKI